MNVLSLFDGMSCGRLALDSLGIKVDNYYAAEIDKYATQVSEANYPDIIRLGDVCGVKAENLPKIDLLLAGSPCQGFSFAGKQLAFDDPRSALFFEFVRILKECKPKYFLLENVKMKKEFLDIITQQVDAQPILINSALLSAQNRQRYYWTNIPGVEQPKQKGVVLKDILETGNISEEYKYSQKSIDYMNRGNEKWKTTRRADKYQQTADKEKSFTVTANWHKGVPYNFFQDDIKTLEKEGEEFDKNLDKMTNKEGKAYCLTARYDGAVAWNSIEKKQRTMIPVVQETHDKPLKVGMNVEEVKVRKHEVDVEKLQQLLREAKKQSKKTNKQIAEETILPITKVEHWFRTDSSFAIPSDEIWFKLKEVLSITEDTFDAEIMEFEYRDGVYETKQRVYSDKGKSPTLTAGNTEQFIETYDTPKQVGRAVDLGGFEQTTRVYSPDGKSPTLTAMGGGNLEPKVIGGAWRGRYQNDTSTKQKLELRKDNKTNAITTVGKDNVVVKSYKEVRTEEAKRLRKESQQQTGKDYTPFRAKELIPREDGKVGTVTPGLNNDHLISLQKLPLPEEDIGERIVVDQEKKQLIIKEATNKGHTIIEDGDCFDITFIDSKTRRGRSMKYKCNALTAYTYDYMIYEHPKDENSDVYWRKLTPVECERLQTVPDNYTNHVSKTQRYKMLGNGWTIDVIAHILKNMQILEEGGELPKTKGQQGFEF